MPDDTVDASRDPSRPSADVRAAAVKAIVGFVKTPANAPGRKHLVDMAAVQSLQGDAEHGRLFRLLNIFATEKVIAHACASACARKSYAKPAGFGIGLSRERSTPGGIGKGGDDKP